MAKERRDSKNRKLERGEYQKEDGRYMYRYTDACGKARFVYSWTLTRSDRTPSGKPAGKCLRDLEKEIAKDVLDGIDRFVAQNTTVDDYFEKYISQKRHIKPTTRTVYRRTYNVYLRDRIGHRKISAIKYSDIAECYNDIIDNHGISISTMSSVDSVLKPIFKMAVKDNIIRNNPADGVLTDISKERNSNKNKKVALTVRQQEMFLNYVSSNNSYNRWKNMFTVMLGTGCRIGEICGLTWDDCDFTNNIIYIRRNLCYSPDEHTGKYRFLLQAPKTESGIRNIPMFSDVKLALQRERVKQMREGFCKDSVDGVSGFVFCNLRNGIMMPMNVNSILNRLVNSYNEHAIEISKKENADPELLPKFSPHILRHTFCTRLCESGMNIKVIQEVMRHSKISMTMDVYNSITQDFKMESFQNIDGKMKIV